MSSSSLSSSPIAAAPSPSMEIQIDLPSIVTQSLSGEPSTTITTTSSQPLKISDECCDDVKIISQDDNAKNIIGLDV